MKRIAAAATAGLLLALSAAAQSRARREPPSADSASVDAIVAALYASVSHPPGGSPDFERLRGVFLYVGMLIPPKRAGDQDFTVLDVDQFAERYRKGAAARSEKGAGAGFVEKEIARRTDCFGNVCQVFSTYESRHAASDPTPFERGINSIQLVRDGERWWIASVIWDAERAGNPLPAQYLPGGRP